MKHLKTIILSISTLLAFCFITKAASLINTEKMENAVKRAAFFPTLISINANTSNMFPGGSGVDITATYSSAWGNKTYASDRISIDIEFDQLQGRPDLGWYEHYHYLVTLYYDYDDASGNAVYFGEYNTSYWPLTSRPLVNLTVNHTSPAAVYPFCQAQ